MAKTARFNQKVVEPSSLEQTPCTRRRLLSGLGISTGVGALVCQSPFNQAYGYRVDRFRPPYPLNSYTNDGVDLETHLFPEGIMHAGKTPTQGSLRVLEGQLPEDLWGHCLVAEGIPLETNHLSPAGLGALSRYDFSPQGVRFKRRLIDTPSALMQQASLGWFDRFRLMGGLLYLSPTLGFMNYCNTVPIPLGDGRFMLGFEGGEPYEFNPHSLELIGPVGHYNEWRSSLPDVASWFTPSRWLFQQVRTTAHPYWDQSNDCLYTINYGGNVGATGVGRGFVDLIEWDKQGPFKRWQVMGRDGQAAVINATTHTFGVTRNCILIVETAAQVEPFRLMGSQVIQPQTHRTPLWVIRRQDLKANRQQVIADYVELNFDTSDIVLDYDDHSGVIQLYGQYLGATDKSEPCYLGEALAFGGKVENAWAGYPVSPVDVGGLVKCAIQVTSDTAFVIPSLTQVLRDPECCWDMNDPAQRSQFQNPERLKHLYWSATGYRTQLVVQRMLDAYRDYPHRVFPADQLPQQDQPSCLMHLDCEAMHLSDSYQFPLDAILRSPQFMPKPSVGSGSQAESQDEGYIITWIVRKHPTAGMGTGKELWVFDAKNLHQGPLCVLGSDDLDFATTNHALWVGHLGTRDPGAYKVDLSSHFRSLKDQHSTPVQQQLEKEVIPRFS